jgi:hypothetical protein
MYRYNPQNNFVIFLTLQVLQKMSPVTFLCEGRFFESNNLNPTKPLYHLHRTLVVVYPFADITLTK